MQITLTKEQHKLLNISYIYFYDTLCQLHNNEVDVKDLDENLASLGGDLDTIKNKLKVLIAASNPK